MQTEGVPDHQVGVDQWPDKLAELESRHLLLEAPRDAGPDPLMNEVADGRVDVADHHEAERYVDLTGQQVDDEEVSTTMKTR